MSRFLAPTFVLLLFLPERLPRLAQSKGKAAKRA